MTRPIKKDVRQVKAWAMQHEMTVFAKAQREGSADCADYYATIYTDATEAHECAPRMKLVELTITYEVPRTKKSKL